jgi:hypothetical protein
MNSAQDDAGEHHNMVLRGDKYVPLGKRLDQLEKQNRVTQLAVIGLVIVHLPQMEVFLNTIPGLAVHLGSAIGVVR